MNRGRKIAGVSLAAISASGVALALSETPKPMVAGANLLVAAIPAVLAVGLARGWPRFRGFALIYGLLIFIASLATLKTLDSFEVEMRTYGTAAQVVFNLRLGLVPTAAVAMWLSLIPDSP